MTTLPPLNPKPPAAGSVQDTVVVHCAACGQAQASYAIICAGDRSERNIWLQAREKAEADGWELKATHVRVDGISPDAEWVCPICVQRARVAAQAVLPPFSGPAAACPKCGQKTVDMAYERAPREHLRRGCKTCGFQWSEQTFDSGRGFWRRFFSWPSTTTT